MSLVLPFSIVGVHNYTVVWPLLVLSLVIHENSFCMIDFLRLIPFGARTTQHHSNCSTKKDVPLASKNSQSNLHFSQNMIGKHRQKVLAIKNLNWLSSIKLFIFLYPLHLLHNLSTNDCWKLEIQMK